MTAVLRLAGRNGQVCLVVGLICGLVLQDLAQVLKPWLPELVAFLIFVAALRIGPRAALGGTRDIGPSLAVIAVYQLALPLLAFGAVWALGLWPHPLAVAVVLMLSAPSVTGSPHFAIMLGHDPAPAMRLLIVGSAVFPITVLPILYLAPGLGSAGEVVGASLRLFAVLFGAAAAGFAVRHFGLPNLDRDGQKALDGLAAIALAVTVVGLMAAIGPALEAAPRTLLFWLVAVLVVNLGLQSLAYSVLHDRPEGVPFSIVAGNRNVALFLLALPPEVTDPLLIFIGCYQVPMYLTPFFMGRLYGRGAEG